MNASRTAAASATARSADVEQSYCSYFSQATSAISPYLSPQDFFGCTTRHPWTLGTLFNFRCSNPFSSKTFTERLDSRRARVKALGALLHVLQDSYAEGHTARGDYCTGSPGATLYSSRVTCKPIREFHSYGMQDSTRHRLADAAPAWGEACGEGAQVDDPVLASAKVLWHVQHQTCPQDFLEDLKARIFPLASTASVKTGAGSCFAR